MNVLVTGGAGYIGTGLVKALAANNEIKKIVVYDNLSRGNRNLFIGEDFFLNDKVYFVQGDLLDTRKLRNVLSDIDTVYHLAAVVTTPFSDQNPHLFEQVNHWGTAELVYAIEESSVKQLVYLSSVSVYGTSTSQKDIKDELNPRTFYGISKMRGEEHVSRLSEKKQVYILRCGNVYGYNKSMRFDAVINRFMFEANFNKRITINGNGEQHRPFIHVKKVTNVLHALLRSPIGCGIYNLVEHNYAVGEIVQELREIYPGLEMLFVNQHMNMRELKVKGSEQLEPYFGETKTFMEELLEFKNAFTF